MPPPHERAPFLEGGEEEGDIELPSSVTLTRSSLVLTEISCLHLGKEGEKGEEMWETSEKKWG